MSALARYYLSEGYRVSGSDLTDSEIIRALKRLGAKVAVGHSKMVVLADTGLIIRTQATTKDNPELKKARAMGIRVLSYPEAIGELTRTYKTIAITGSHGKSTTTALVALIMIAAGLDPTVIIGTKLKEFGNSNFRKGKSGWLVLEADDYGYAFHHFSPFVALVTNIDREHLDIYKTFAGVKFAFLKFFANICEGGHLVLNRANQGIQDIEKQIYTIRNGNQINVHWYGTVLAVARAVERGNFPALFGAHHISNASGAYTLAKILGIDEKIIMKTLKSFKGTWRRLEYKGKFAIRHMPYAISVYDDYGHHPTEIQATLAALKTKYPKSKIACVYQPHQIDRLKRLFPDFIKSFDTADLLITIPIYKVPGRDEAPNAVYNSKTLALKVAQRKAAPRTRYLANPKILKSTLSTSFNEIAPKGPWVVVMMGAGDIVNYTPLLLK